MSLEATAVLIGAASLFVLGVVLILRVLSGKRSHELDVPNLPRVWPWGNLPQLSDPMGFYEKLEKLAKRSGNGIGAVYFMASQRIVVFKPEHAKKVLTASNYRKQMPIVSRHDMAFFGKFALTHVQKQEWKRHRAVISKAFHLGNLREFANTMHRTALKLADYLTTVPPGETVQLLDLMKMTAMDVIGENAFGYDFGCTANAKNGRTEELKAFEYLVDQYSYRLTHPSLQNWFYWLPTANNRKHHATKHIIRSCIDRIVSSRQKELSQGTNLGRKDLLQHLIDMQSKDKGWCQQEFSDELFVLLFAGFDTTSLALTYAFWLISQSPEVETKLHAEVDEALGGNEPLTFDDVQQKLIYTTQIIKEALRLYPPAPVTARTLEDDLDLGDLIVPRGTNMIIPIWTIHRSEDNWEDALAFRPERFEDAGDVSGRWLPFSGGQRNCVGQRFALLEAAITLATVARHVRIVFPTDYVIQPVASGVIQKPKDGVPVFIEQRHE